MVFAAFVVASTESAGALWTPRCPWPLSCRCRTIFIFIYCILGGFRMFWPFGHFSTSWSLLGPFVHANFGGSGGWTVFPVPSIFPGVQLNCWTLVIVGLPVCRMARCTLCAALPGDPPGAIFNVGGDRNTMAVGAKKQNLCVLAPTIYVANRESCIDASMNLFQPDCTR